MRLLLLLFVLAPTALPQATSTTGAIQGAVVDSSGAAMAGVKVTAAEKATSGARSAVTDDNGQFRLPGLAIGPYELRAEKEGFGTVVVSPVQVSVGQTAVERLEMKPANVIEQVNVREQAEALDTTGTSSSATLGGERIEETPAQNRNYLNFVLVAPGVAGSPGSNSQRAAAGSRSATPDSGFSFGGMRGRNNSLSIDGVDNRDETTGGNRVAIGLEMVQEFLVSGAILGAEFGGAAGGAVNVVTRSGANLWHGDATFFGQNELPNARNPEAEITGHPRFRRYQPGTSLNGPIRRDRTFFSTAIEQEWEQSEEWSETPEDAQQAIRQTLARPDFARAATHDPYRGLFPAKETQTEFSFKLNHLFRTSQALSARYAYSRGRLEGDVQALDNFIDRTARGSSITADHSFVAGLVSVPRPDVINDLRVQAARRRVDLTPASRGAMLEIPGVLTLGQPYLLDGSRTEDHYQVVEGLTLTRGRHQVSLGASVHTARLESRLANRFGGIFLFPTLNDFLRGAPDVFIQAFGDPRTHLNTTPVGTWLQDRWQAARGLTLEAGLRYDPQRLPAPFSDTTGNISPRVGIAWQPRGKGPYVFRAGFGLFYDRYPLAFLNDAVQKDGVHGFEQYLTGDLARRAFAAGQGGSLLAPLAGAPLAVYRPAADFPTTYSRKINAGLQRSLGKDTTFTAEYASVRGFHLPRTRSIAPGIYQLEQNSKSSYQGVSLSVNRRMSKELTFLVAYGAGRTHDDASDYDEQPLDPLNLRQDWARSRQHQAQRLAASALFDLPVEDWHSAPGWLREGLENLSVAPILTLGSGRPLNALDSTDTFRTGAYPISARPFGLGRNPYLSPGSGSLDLRLMKSHWIKEHRAVWQYGLEFFNLTNHSNPLRVSPFYAAGGARLASYKTPVETLNARQIQVMVQFEY